MAQTGSITYLNGAFLPLEEARISILDRGFQFADGVYELIPVYAGRPFRLEAHLIRLERSLAEIGLSAPMARKALADKVDQLIQRNEGHHCKVYIQITRGVAERDHAFPLATKPTMVMTCSPLETIPEKWIREGIGAITAEDIRWARCDIKSIALLPNVMLRQKAVEAGAVEGIWTHQGQVTEAAAANVFAVIDGEARTPPDGPRVLPGITRNAILELAKEATLSVHTGPVTVQELQGAEEIWVTSSTKGVLPVTHLDGQPVGRGEPGSLFWKVQEAFRTHLYSAEPP